MKIFCLKKREVPALYKQIQGYIKNGIKIEEGDTIFDVGANIGLFSLWTYQKYQKNVSLYAFEPIPTIFNVLKANAERFDRQRIKVYPYGLSQKSGKVTFAYYPNASPLSGISPYNFARDKDNFKQAAIQQLKEEAPFYLKCLNWLPIALRSIIITPIVKQSLHFEEVIAEVKTISQIINEQNIEKIDLLKIDVEKSELDVLLGIKDEDWSKIEQIVVEVHNINNRVETIQNLLKKYEFFHQVVEQEPVMECLNIRTIYAKRDRAN